MMKKSKKICFYLYLNKEIGVGENDFSERGEGE